MSAGTDFGLDEAEQARTTFKTHICTMVVLNAMLTEAMMLDPGRPAVLRIIRFSKGDETVDE